jgi:hypothetical protein
MSVHNSDNEELEVVDIILKLVPGWFVNLLVTALQHLNAYGILEDTVRTKFRQ